MDKYNGNLPKQYHENVVNREIKKIGKDAGLDRIRFTWTEGGVQIHRAKPLHELLSTHTCRRSIVRNKLRKGVSPYDLMSVTGMSVKTLMHYDEVDAEDNADRLVLTHPEAFPQTKNRPLN